MVIRELGVATNELTQAPLSRDADVDKPGLHLPPHRLGGGDQSDQQTGITERDVVARESLGLETHQRVPAKTARHATGSRRRPGGPPAGSAMVAIGRPPPRRTRNAW